MRPWTLSLSLVLAGAPGCWWTAPANDAGDEAFVAQVIPALLGRRPRGSEEVRALSAIATSAGRAAVVDLLLEQPQFIDYWAQVLADDLQVQREGAASPGQTCYGPALLPPSVHDQLVDHLISAYPEDPFCPEEVPEPRYRGITAADALGRAESAEQVYRYTPVDQLRAPRIPELPLDPRRVPTPASPTGRQGVPDLPSEASAIELPRIEWDGRPFDRSLIEPDHGLLERIQRSNLTDPCPPFNQTDVLRASVSADDLRALYRGYLPTLATFPPSTSSEGAKRSYLGRQFREVYLQRDLACVGCHTSTYSTTDPLPRNNLWDRFFPAWIGLGVRVDLEGSLWSWPDGAGGFTYGGDGGSKVQSNTNNLFRTDIHSSSGGFRPFGLDHSCVTNAEQGYSGFAVGVVPDTSLQAGIAGAVGSDVNVLHLIDRLRQGITTMDQLDFVVPDWQGQWPAGTDASAGEAVYQSNCVYCHDAGLAPALQDVVPTLTDPRLVSVMLNGSSTGLMPPMIGSEADAWDVVAYLRGSMPYSPAHELADRTHALAFLLGTGIVNNVVEEVYGERLVADHGHPRNAAQQQALSELTWIFIEDWSLRELLREIVLSEAFARSAPQQTPDAQAYSLPMYLFPWAETPPGPDGTVPASTPPGADANSEADGVHRYSVAHLLLSVHDALGWPEPRVIGPTEAYPDRATMRDLGRYHTVAAAGSDDVDLATLLAWEVGPGSCVKPDDVYAGDVQLVAGLDLPDDALIEPEDWVDFIDRIVEEGTSQGATLADAVSAIRDRLLSDPQLDADEAALIADAMGLPDLSGPLTAAAEDDLRDTCGVYLKSPGFLLQGIGASLQVGPDAPSLLVCGDEGAPCDVDHLCEGYAARAVVLGHDAAACD